MGSAKRVRRRLALTVGLLAAIGLFGAACAALGPDVDFPTDQDPAFTRRIDWDAPSGRVSGLVGGVDGARRVVFVHGTPGFAASWSDHLDGGLDGYETVALDRPGFGLSEPEGAVAELLLQAAAIEPLLEPHPDGLPIVVGHSLGGPIALRVASDFPDRVGGLVILAGNVDPMLEEWRWYNRAAEWIDWALTRSWRNSNRELEPHREELILLASRLDRITCPVVIVHGTEDTLVPYANAEFLERSLPNAASVELRTLEGDDHFFVFRDTAFAWDAVRTVAGGPPGDVTGS